VIYVNSFTLSQKDMFASALHVTGTSEAEWTITKEPARERYATGLEEIKEGKMVGFAKMLYTRVFFDDGCGDTEHGKGTANVVLGLEMEDENIDEYTRKAVERAKINPWG